MNEEFMPARMRNCMYLNFLRSFFPGFCLLAGAQLATAVQPLPVVEMKPVGGWQVKVICKQGKDQDEATLKVSPNAAILVAKEMHATLPVFNPQASGWKRGVALQGVRAQETTTPGLIDAGSVVVKSTAGEPAQVFKAGEDYLVDEVWGTLGRVEGGAIAVGQPVQVSYQYWPLRLDHVVRTADGRIEWRSGAPKAAAPLPPVLSEGEQLLGRVWLPGKVQKIQEANLFPVLEQGGQELPVDASFSADRLAPKAVARLRSGEKLRILAWGDSVTHGSYLPHPERERWQEQFVQRLKTRYPTASIELMTEAWPGKNTSSYLAEPPGAEHHYPAKVLGLKPDLIVSEFVNDASLNPAGVEKIYGRLLKDFRSIGAEWIILTPHYTFPQWMKFTQEREIDQDPRAYVTALREFARKNDVALADASLRYGRLWRQGLPYTTLMLNSLNHPDARGMAIFADALMALFP